MIGFPLDTFMVRPAGFIIVFCLMTAFLVVAPAPARGGEFRLVPSVKVQEEYDDNIFYAAKESQESDFVSTVTPGVELKVEDPRLAASLKGSVAGISYVDNNALNAVDQFLTAGLTYMLTQRLRTQVNLNFTQDSQPGRDVEATGLPILITSGRARQQYNVGGDYTFSEKTALNFSYAFYRDRYENAALAGFQAHSFGLGLNHDLSQYVPELTGTMNVSTIRYDYPNIDVQSTTMTLGASWKYSEKVSLSGEIGPRFTRSEFEVPVTLFGFPTGRLRTETNDGQGWGGRLSYACQGLLTKWELSLSRDLDQASGRSGTTERTTTGLDIARRLTEELSIGLYGGYYLNQSGAGEFASQEIDTRTWRAQPRIMYKVSQNLALQASYGFSMINEESINENSGDVERTKNVVFLELRYEHPFFE
ncbi:MAG: hypothetical protein COX17_01785 [Deltaproteobacteria bacterium CG23_combo_of_CG06-09_8_20_14_all_60_8]|nr:MAG: hypothetical protein AUK28_05225 [Desulfobacterales bacterium CG2_30_60_27]PIP44377.1 MAG: hypothetical protein COX17_01785 [Deltaproteobacteria bacterium CG23_combo_of_CG06-09_8_20_14_all_60_8]